MLKIPRMRSSDIRLMLQEQYELIFGIYDHKSPHADPLALVLMHPAENVGDGGAIEQCLDAFMGADVYKFTGVSWIEFLNSPREYCDLLIKKSRLRQEAELKALQGKGTKPPGT